MEIYAIWIFFGLWFLGFLIPFIGRILVGFESFLFVAVAAVVITLLMLTAMLVGLFVFYRYLLGEIAYAWCWALVSSVISIFILFKIIDYFDQKRKKQES